MFRHAEKNRGGAVIAELHVSFRRVFADIGIAMDAHSDASPLGAVDGVGLEPAFPFIFPSEKLGALDPWLWKNQLPDSHTTRHRASNSLRPV